MNGTLTLKKKKTEPPVLYQEDKVGIFVDGETLYAMLKIAGLDADYKSLTKYLQERSRLTRAYYATVLIEVETPGREKGHMPLRMLTDYLSYNGWIVNAKVIPPGSNGDFSRIKGDVIMDMADALYRCAGNYDHVLLVSGNGILTKAVAYLQEKGTRVTLLGTLAGEHPIVSDSLRKQCDSFVDIAEHDFDGAFMPMNGGQ